MSICWFKWRYILYFTLNYCLATDILMHTITLLNDKKDWRIRATFYETAPIVAKHLGQNRCRKLKPFLQQVIFIFNF